jgi:hypothetical protein
VSLRALSDQHNHVKRVPFQLTVSSDDGADTWRGHYRQVIQLRDERLAAEALRSGGGLRSIHKVRGGERVNSVTRVEPEGWVLYF